MSVTITREDLNMKVVLADAVPTKELSIIGQINTIIENEDMYAVKKQYDGQISYMVEDGKLDAEAIIITTYVADLPTGTVTTIAKIDNADDCANLGYIWTDINATTGLDDGDPTCKVLSTFVEAGCTALGASYVWSTTNELGETVAAHCRLKTDAELAAEFVASGTCIAAGYWWDSKNSVCLDAGNGHAPDGYVQGGQPL